jgi:hypothetical protein
MLCKFVETTANLEFNEFLFIFFSLTSKSGWSLKSCNNLKGFQNICRADK